MIEKLERAIEKVKRLPDDRQIYAAMLLDQVAAGGVFAVPADHQPSVLEGLAQARRGERATDAEMAALWKKCGL
ncbi:MAG: hypothetical protein ABL893_18180 [Hyphomicrobium sp.]|nr:hypothetical protein [Hyphomicrobium sp.]